MFCIKYIHNYTSEEQILPVGYIYLCIFLAIWVIFQENYIENVYVFFPKYVMIYIFFIFAKKTMQRCL